MTSRGTHTSTRQVRVDPELWSTFGEAIKRVDPELDRSAFLRMVMRWTAADPAGAIKTVRDHAGEMTRRDEVR